MPTIQLRPHYKPIFYSLNHLVMSKTQFLTTILSTLIFFSTEIYAFQYEIIHYEAGTVDQTAFDFKTKSDRKVALFKGDDQVQASNEVKEFINGDWTTLNMADLNYQEIQSIDLGLSGELIIATADGLYKQVDGNTIPLLTNYNIDLVEVNPFDGAIYFVEEQALYRFDGPLSVTPMTENIGIDDIQFRSSSAFLIKSGADLYEYSNNVLEERYVPGGLKYWSMDPNNRMWIVTEDNQFLKENDFSNYWEIPVYSEHLIIEGTTAMDIDKDGNVWIANEDEYGRLMKWEPGSSNSLMISTDLLFNDTEVFLIEKLISDDEGNLYMINNEKETLIELSYYNPVSSTNTLNEIKWNFGPNPVGDILNLNIEESFDSAQLNILDQTGRILNQMTVTGQSSEQLDVNDLKPGFYFLQIRNEEFLAIQKFIKL